MRDGITNKIVNHEKRLVEPLTTREQEVLLLLNQHLRYQDIAEQLNLALSSVKWFVRQIYGKLGVNNRREALLRAQELGLLEIEGKSSTSNDSLSSPKKTKTSGLMTVFIIDIEESSWSWEQLSETMQPSAVQLQMVMKETIESHEGQIIQAIGNTYQVVFWLASQGVYAAIALQRLFKENRQGAADLLKARMGLHAGLMEIDPVRNPSYPVSQTLARVSRITQAGHGGQILLSKEAADLVEQQLPEGVTLKDLGEHYLKGLQHKEHLYQITAPDLPENFPPITTNEARRSNLPVQLTSFIGREKELSEVCRLLETSRLVTLTGSGGTGKTRLSLRAAEQVVERYPDGVWLGELSPLTDGNKIPQLIATTFGLHDSRNRTALELLVGYLSDKHLLLVLDNCEHLIEACARLADHLLRACPGLTILASSREPLSVSGEVAYRVPSLGVPEQDQPLSPDELLQFESVRLLAERAATTLLGFTVSASNAPFVAQICRRLDGIPLAIEMAAARVGLLTIEQIADRLDDRFRLLSSGSRTALPRHKTLRTSIDWSYSLLVEREQLLLMRLSVFVGGWRLDAAEYVCGYDALEDSKVLDGLDGLVKKSLVVADSQNGPEARYHLLETVRQYAREKLLDRETGEILRDRHLDYYLRLAERAEPHLRSHEQITWNDRLQEEAGNLRSAMVWSEVEQVEKGLRMVWALRMFWHERGHAYRGEIIDWLDRVLTAHSLPAHAPKAQVQIWANAINTQAFILIASGRNQEKVIERLETAQAMYESLGPAGRSGLVFLYFWWGAFYYYGRHDRIGYKELLEKSYLIAEEQGDLFGMAEVLIWKNSSEDISKNLQDKERGLALRRQIGDLEGIWWDLLNLAILYGAIGDLQRALHLSEDGLAIVQRVKNGWGLALHQYHRGLFFAQTGNYQKAVTWIELGLEKGKRMGDPFITLIFQTGLASVLHKQGNNEAAQDHFQEAVALARKEGFRYEEAMLYFCQGEIAWARGNYPEATRYYQEALAAGQETQSDDEAFGHYGLGKVALANGEWKTARRHFHQAIKAWTRMEIHDYVSYVFEAAAVLICAPVSGEQMTIALARDAVRLHGAGQAYQYLSKLPFYTRPHFETYDMDICTTSAREILGEEGYQRAYAEGQELTLEEAVELALEVTQR